MGNFCSKVEAVKDDERDNSEVEPPESNLPSEIIPLKSSPVRDSTYGYGPSIPESEARKRTDKYTRKKMKRMVKKVRRNVSQDFGTMSLLEGGAVRDGTAINKWSPRKRVASAYNKFEHQGSRPKRRAQDDSDKIRMQRRDAFHRFRSVLRDQERLATSSTAPFARPTGQDLRFSSVASPASIATFHADGTRSQPSSGPNTPVRRLSTVGLVGYADPRISPLATGSLQSTRDSQSHAFVFGSPPKLVANGAVSSSSSSSTTGTEPLSTTTTPTPARTPARCRGDVPGGTGMAATPSASTSSSTSNPSSAVHHRRQKTELIPSNLLRHSKLAVQSGGVESPVGGSVGVGEGEGENADRPDKSDVMDQSVSTKKTKAERSSSAALSLALANGPITPQSIQALILGDGSRSSTATASGGGGGTRLTRATTMQPSSTRGGQVPSVRGDEMPPLLLRPNSAPLRRVPALDALDVRVIFLEFHFKEGTRLFNLDPYVGLQYLIVHGLLPYDDPAAVANYFVQTRGLSKRAIGEFFGDDHDFNERVLAAYTEVMGVHMGGMRFDPALRMYLSGFRLPGESQQIDRIMEQFAEQYCKMNPTMFSCPATAFVLSFSLIMLNTDLHNPNIKEKNRMTLEQFIRNNRGIDQGEDLPRELLVEFYNNIRAHEIVMIGRDKEHHGDNVSFLGADKEGWLRKEGRGGGSTKRWFLLMDNYLYYFKRPSEVKGGMPRCRIDLDGVVVYPSLRKNGRGFVIEGSVALNVNESHAQGLNGKVPLVQDAEGAESVPSTEEAGDESASSSSTALPGAAADTLPTSLASPWSHALKDGVLDLDSIVSYSEADFLDFYMATQRLRTDEGGPGSTLSPSSHGRVSKPGSVFGDLVKKHKASVIGQTFMSGFEGKGGGDVIGGIGYDSDDAWEKKRKTKIKT